MKDRIRVLSLQAYWGGSHQQFLEGWIENSSFEWTTITLPARHWKWRMRHASIFFAEEVRRRVEKGQHWDAVFCTDMLGVADFKGLVGGEVARLPLVVYFHENQFAYPSQFDYQRDQHFPFTNFVSALVADEAWFNSRYNFDSMMEGLARHSKRWPDFIPTSAIDSLASKIRIQPPGIDLPPIDLARFAQHRKERADQREPIHLVWAARWEHDKDPMALFDALELLDDAGIPFRISLIGQEFPKIPPGISKIRKAFPNAIRRWGFQPTRLDYWNALAEADVFVSTAVHEFFGLSAAEAIAVGVFPLLPDRLAYPELLAYGIEPNQIAASLYDGTPKGLFESIRRIEQERYSGGWQPDVQMAPRLISQIGWRVRAPQLDESLARIVD